MSRTGRVIARGTALDAAGSSGRTARPAHQRTSTSYGADESLTIAHVERASFPHAGWHHNWTPVKVALRVVADAGQAEMTLERQNATSNDALRRAARQQGLATLSAAGCGSASGG